MCNSEAMQTRQTIALLAVLAVLLAVAYGTSLLTPPTAGTASIDPILTQALQQPFNLTPHSSVVIRKHEGAFYLLDIHPDPSEGGGFWALVKQVGADIAILDYGNKGEYELRCSLLDSNAVPSTLERFCYNEVDLIDRSTGATTTEMDIWDIEDPEWRTR